MKTQFTELISRAGLRLYKRQKALCFINTDHPKVMYVCLLNDQGHQIIGILHNKSVTKTVFQSEISRLTMKCNPSFQNKAKNRKICRCLWG